MSVNQSKANILNRLRASQQMIVNTESETEKKDAINNASGKEVLTRLLENNRAILIETDYKELAQNINSQIKQLQPRQYLVSQHPRLNQLLGDELTESNQYKLADTWSEAKQQLFEDIELSICFADAALCEQGALLLKADKNQPRNLSLIPETSFIVVEASNIFHDLQQCVQSAHCETRNLQSNMVLISGPSKTADIQQTLAYGAHGPKHLVVFIVN